MPVESKLVMPQFPKKLPIVPLHCVVPLQAKSKILSAEAVGTDTIEKANTIRTGKINFDAYRTLDTGRSPFSLRCTFRHTAQPAPLICAILLPNTNLQCMHYQLISEEAGRFSAGIGQMIAYSGNRPSDSAFLT